LRNGDSLPRVTCTIITLNEVDRIERTIRSVEGIADEVLVVDSGSSDGTVALAERLGAKVIHNPWRGYGPQKRFAEDQAQHDWILNLDADEWLSDGLRAEFKALLSASPPPPSRSFRMRVRIVYPRRQTPAPFAHFHTYVRFYNRGATRFAESLAHDEVPPTADVVDLRCEVLHKSYRDFAHIVTKTIGYYELQKKERKARRVRLPLRAFVELPFQFFKYYIIRRHVFGGADGFAYAAALAIGRWCRVFILNGW
jgi:glycosyltransferase involved in cell wall biosynthesis